MLIDEYKKFLQTGYFDNDNIEKCELFLEYPIKLAKEFKNGLSYKQIRNIFNKLNTLSFKLKTNQQNMKSIHNELLLLYSNLYDKFNKNTISKSFLDFFKINIDTIKNEQDFYCFIKHLQCICNFYPKDTNNNHNKNNSFSKNNGGYKK